MDTAQVVDVVVVLSVAAAFLGGWSRGLGRTVGGLAGAVLGAAAAVLLVIPWVVESAAASSGQLPLAFLAGLVTIALATGLGSALGGVLGRGLTRLRLGWADTVGGALAGATATAIAWVLVSTFVPLTGSAPLADGVAGARTVQALTRVAPPALRDGAAIASMLERHQPWLADVAGSPSTSPTIPNVDVDTAAIRAATRSVVRVSGDAADCHQVVTGSGFVVAPDRVVTNAHVVAGVGSPIIRAPGELPVRGRVVHLDEKNDLAVIATTGLDAPALRVGDDAPKGSEAVVAGYPRGGPLRLDPAQLLARRTTVVSVDGTTGVRPVLMLAAAIAQGNSGGPVLGQRGQVVGVVFAKSVGVDGVAYAVPMSVVEPLAGRASSLVDEVPTGRCRAA